MNKLISVVIASVLIVGCQSQEEKNQEIMVEKCAIYLKATLKDPYSVKYEFESISSINTIKTITIRYNAKNSYGGYVGNKSFYCSLDSGGNVISTL